MAEQPLSPASLNDGDKVIAFAKHRLGLREEVSPEGQAAIRAAVGFIRQGGDFPNLLNGRLSPEVKAALDCTVDWFLIENAARSFEERERQWAVHFKVYPRD